jgi:hypothetical protein
MAAAVRALLIFLEVDRPVNPDVAARNRGRARSPGSRASGAATSRSEEFHNCPDGGSSMTDDATTSGTEQAVGHQRLLSLLLAMATFVLVVDTSRMNDRRRSTPWSGPRLPLPSGRCSVVSSPRSFRGASGLRSRSSSSRSCWPASESSATCPTRDRGSRRRRIGPLRPGYGRHRAGHPLCGRKVANQWAHSSQSVRLRWACWSGGWPDASA